MIKISEEIKKKFGRRFLINEKLANYSWFNLGGPAEFFFKPENINDLIDFLKEVRPNKIGRLVRFLAGPMPSTQGLYCR